MSIFTPEQATAIRERRGFATDHVIATTTKGGTYVIASSGKWNDSGLPRDLLAILPGDLGQGRVLALYIAVSPDLIAEVEAILSDAEAGQEPNATIERTPDGVAHLAIRSPFFPDTRPKRAPMYGGRDEDGL